MFFNFKCNVLLTERFQTQNEHASVALSITTGYVNIFENVPFTENLKNFS